MPLPLPIRLTLALLAVLALLEFLAVFLFGILALLLAPGGTTFCIEVALVCAVLAVWSFFTLLRIARLRSWGRKSILILATGLVLLGGYGVGADLYEIVREFYHRAPPAYAHGAFLSLALLYLVLALIGIWWLVFFNRRTTRDLFDPKP